MLDSQCLVSFPVLLCKTGWQQVFATPVTPIDTSFCPSLDEETTKELQQLQQCLVSSPVLHFKTGWQQLFVTVTPIDICFHTSLERETTFHMNRENIRELQQC